ncbi:MAG: ArsR family transcriptional regulator [Stackebrandtia sp.]
MRIVDSLAIGDASPRELERGLGLSSNLLAHHLKTLADAGVVVRNRSEGDRRRTYLRLVPEALAGLQTPPVMVAARVVFVCTHNTARSQLAEAAWRQYSRIPVASAGTDPAERVHPLTVSVASRHGLRLPSGETAHVSDVAEADDLVIVVCDSAHESMPHRARQLHWSVPDPVLLNTDIAFESAFADVSQRVNRLAPMLAAETGAS